MSKNEQRVQPVSKGDEVIAVCENIGQKGDGIFKVKGYAIIVPYTMQGKKYKIKITNTTDRCAFGEIVEGVNE